MTLSKQVDVDAVKTSTHVRPLVLLSRKEMCNGIPQKTIHYYTCLNIRKTYLYLKVYGVKLFLALISHHALSLVVRYIHTSNHLTKGYWSS